MRFHEQWVNFFTTNELLIVTRQSKKIGFIFNHPYFLGGGEHSFFALLQSLENSDFEPIGIVPAPGEILEKIEKSGIPGAICPLSSLRHGLWKYFLRDLLILAKAVRRHDIKIIHANGSRACLYGGIVGRVLDIPVIWHVRETIRDYFLYDGLLGLLATKIVCVSRAIARKRFGRFGIVLARKMEIVYNGVDTDTFRMSEDARHVTRSALGIEVEEVLISVVANFIPLKGHEFLMKGLAEACKRNPDIRVKLLCVGRMIYPDYHKALRSLAGERGLDSRVIFRDYTTDVSGILSATDIFALPSQREGFSRSLLEAMCMGLPVLASRISAIAEAVEDKSGGILVDYGDVGSMATAILMLCRERQVRERMGKRNREHVVTRFSMELHRNAFENIYSSLLQSETR